MFFDDIKWIADAYRIKCDKYKPEQLTSELCDKLFDEAFNEYCTMVHINTLSSENLHRELI